ncbi:MAG: hypothetical protein Fur0021_25630 [Candidatus Promineifilaceae bacterium]
MTKANGEKPQMIEIVEEKENVVIHNAHRLIQVGLGVVALGQEALDGTQDWFVESFDKLVERGEALEKDGRRMLDDMFKRRKDQAQKATDKAETELDRRLEELLARMNVPTRDDIKELTAKVNALNRKVDELKKATVTS